MKKSPLAAYTVGVFGFVFTMMTPARADVALGLLTCRSPDSSGYLFVSTQKLDCAFTPSSGGEVQYYEAIIRRYGAQIGYSGKTTMGWAVVTSTTRVGAGALAGEYGGVSAGAAVGVGVSANGLVGGFNNAIALQPVSVEGETGLNVVATVTGLELDSVVPLRVRHNYRNRRHHHG